MRVVKTGNSHDMFSSAVPVLEDVDALEADPGVESVVWDPKVGRVGRCQWAGKKAGVERGDPGRFQLGGFPCYSVSSKIVGCRAPSAGRDMGTVPSASDLA